MSGHLHYNSLIPHKCRCRAVHPYADQYCSFCGIFISPNDAIVYLRPASFSNFNAIIGDQSLILIKMVKKQTIHKFYTKDAFHLPFRVNMVCWLEKSVRKLNLVPSTIHLSTAIIDIVMSSYAIPDDKMEVMIFTALNMAGKMEDRDDRLPNLKDVPDYFQKEIKKTDLEACEKIVFEVLNFSVNIQTPYHFACYFISCGVISNQDLDGNCASALLSEFERLMSLFASASLREYELYRFEAVVVGAAMIAGTRKALGLHRTWTDHLKRMTKVSWTQLKVCVDILEHTAINLHGAQLKVQNLLPRLKKNKSRNLIGTADKEISSIVKEKSVNQVFDCHFDCENMYGDEIFENTILSNQKSAFVKEL